MADTPAPTTPPPTERLRTTRQVLSERPWLTERYLRRLVFERRIPHYKLDPGKAGKLLFDLADIDALAEAGRVDAA